MAKTDENDPWLDLGLLALRLGSGLTMAIAHGWPKLGRWAGSATQFADPIGVGPAASLALALFGELVCGVLIAAGLFTRLAAVPFAITMLVAAFVVHGADPFRKKELALAYALAGIVVALTGPGRFSVDAKLFPDGLPFLKKK